MSESFFKKENRKNPDAEIPDLKGAPSAGGSRSSADSGFETFKTEEGRVAAIMSYIPFLCFIPLLNMRDNKEALMHARQGVILFLIELVAVIFLIDFISDLVFTGILMVALALSVAGIYFAMQGRNYELPIISDLAKKTDFYSDKNKQEKSDN